MNLAQLYSVFQTPYGVQWNVNLSQPYSHMAYKGMWTSLSPTLCSRHHWHTMECEPRSALLCVPDTIWHTIACEPSSSLLCVPDSIWRTIECEPYSALLCVPDSIWRTMECEPYSTLLCVPDSIWCTIECKLTQPCSVAEPSATCSHPRRAEGKHSILHPARKWPNSIFSPCLAGKLDWMSQTWLPIYSLVSTLGRCCW